MTLTGSANAMVIVGVFSLIIMLILLNVMKSKVGLKPEEYDTKDIEFKVPK